jgi:hypothetical protein
MIFDTANNCRLHHCICYINENWLIQHDLFHSNLTSLLIIIYIKSTGIGGEGQDLIRHVAVIGNVDLPSVGGVALESIIPCKISYVITLLIL